MMEKEPERLWQARPRKAPIHVLRPDDRTYTVCGKSIHEIGGQSLQEGVAASTCKACRDAVASHGNGTGEDTRPRDAAWWQRYDTYLATSEWASVRERVLARAGGLCEGCRLQPASIAHHLTYCRMGSEMIFDLVAVCRQCHDAIHGFSDTRAAEG